jgi:hypothetical protein
MADSMVQRIQNDPTNVLKLMFLLIKYLLNIDKFLETIPIGVQLLKVS